MTPQRVEYRVIPGFPHHRVGSDRSFRSSRASGGAMRPLMPLRTTAGRPYVKLWDGSRYYALFVETIFCRVFPELAGNDQRKAAVEYRPLPGWPGYRVGSNRSVWVNRVRAMLPPPWNRPYWRRLKAHSKNGQGSYVELHTNGRECVRSVELLYRAAFAPAAHHPGWIQRIGPPVPQAPAPSSCVPAAAVELPAIAVAEAPAPPVEYRPVPGFPRYRLGSDLSLWFCRRSPAETLCPVAMLKTAAGSPCAWLRADTGAYRLTVDEIARATFPERPWPSEDARSALVEYLALPGFPRHVVGSDKSVWSFTQSTGRELLGLPPFWQRLSIRRRPGWRPVVQLYRDGKGYVRQLEDVVREAFAVTFPRGSVHAETQARGSAHGRARLDESKVAEARELSAAGWSVDRLAERYGVAANTMGYAVRGVTWQHVPMPHSPAADGGPTP